MPNYSNTLKANFIRTSSEEPHLVLLEIDNDLLSTPIRIIRDTKDIVHNGNTYVACWFECNLPSEADKEVPRASIQIDNISKNIVRYFEQLQGGPDTTVKFIEVLRSNPDFVERSLTLDLIDVTITPFHIKGTLMLDNLASKIAVPMVYNKFRAPALF